MMDESMKLPSGYRFNPFEKELITYYLKPKVLGQKLPCNVVEERQLYGPNANPWQVFDPENHSWILSEVTPGKFEKIAYIFVNLTKKAAVERKNKVARDNYIKKAGCGTWDGQTKRSEIRDSNGDLIGDKRLLVFEINEVSNLDLSKVGYWKMHEYHLCGINEDVINSSNTVLCKITLDYSKNPPVKSRHKINHDHPIKSSSKPQKKNTNMDIVSSVDGNQGAVTTQAYRVKEEKGCGGTDIVETFDGVECMSSNYGKKNTLAIASSPLQVNTRHLKQAASTFLRPARFDNEYQKINEEEGKGRDLYLGMPKVQLSSYLKPKEETPPEDSANNLRKRKIQVETLYARTKKLCP